MADVNEKILLNLGFLKRLVNRTEEDVRRSLKGLESFYVENPYLNLPLSKIYRKSMEEIARYTDLNIKVEEKATVVDLPSEIELPVEFLCPFSKKLMLDPVTLVTGETYERAYIKTWLDQGFRFCPISHQLISEHAMISNTILQKVICRWISERGGKVVKLPRQTSDELFMTRMLRAGYPCWPKKNFSDILLSWCKRHEIEIPKLGKKSFRNDPVASKFFRVLLKGMGINGQTDFMLQSSCILREVTRRFPNTCSYLTPPSIIQVVVSLGSTGEVVNDPLDTIEIFKADLVATIVNMLILAEETKSIFQKDKTVSGLLRKAYGKDNLDAKHLGALGLYLINKITATSEAMPALLEYVHEASLLPTVRTLNKAVHNLWNALSPSQQSTVLDQGLVTAIYKKVQRGKESVGEYLPMLTSFAEHPNSVEAFNVAKAEVGDMLQEADRYMSQKERKYSLKIKTRLHQDPP